MACKKGEGHESEVMYFARTNFRNALRKFGIKTDDRRRHTYVIGKTGMGKTTLMENMILEDIYAGHGCCYVDPHGDTAEKLLNYIPKERVNDVVYFNPADYDHPIGFNILESVDFNQRHVVASGLMSVFKKIWPDVWSARMEHIMNNAILTLLENPGNTMMGINRVLVERDFRRKMVAGIKDPVVRAFWLTEFEQWDPKFRVEAIAPIQNKVGQFLSTALVRNIIAQRKSTINMREIMDTEKILIVNLSKGRIGEDAMRLLGGMFINQMQLSAMGRVDIPENKRNDFYLYIDEFQNFATESFASILSEARKYRLCLTMAHQYIEQLTEEVRDAVFGNVGTIITFRVGSPDAVVFEQEFAPNFIQEDLVNLPKFCVYLRLMIDGVVSKPFSALTLPPIANATNLEPEVLEFSRTHYGRPREDVERAILAWSEMGGSEEEIGAMFDKVESEKKEERKARFRPQHEYDCTRCNKKMVLPVELDRSRPIYCEECIELVRGERQAGKDRKRTSPGSTAAPKVAEGELIAAKPSASISLSAIASAAGMAPSLPKSPSAVMPVVRPPVPTSPSVPSPVRPVTASVPASSISTSIPRPPETEEQKKKRRRRKKRTGEMAPSSSSPPPTNSKPSLPPPTSPARPSVQSPPHTSKPKPSNPDDAIFPW